MKKNQQQLESIHCDGCGAPLHQGTGRFLKPVALFCDDCKRRTKFYPSKKSLDAHHPVDVNVIRTK